MALIDRIKYDAGPGEIVWKYPKEDIVWGGQLIVNESQECIFVKGGQTADLFGPGTYTLKSGNIPLLEKLINLPFGGDTPFTAEIWYVNKTPFFGLKWGTKTPIQVEDPKFGILTNLRGHGIYGFRVVDTRHFIKEIVGTKKALNTEQIDSLFKDIIASDIEELLSKIVHEQNIDIIRINTQRSQIEEAFKPILAKKFEDYGLELGQFEIVSLNIPQDDPGYKTLVEARAKRAAAVEQAMSDKAQMDILGAAYQQKRMLDIGEAAAKNEGQAGGMMGAGMGMGMGMNMAQMMGGMMNAQNTQAPASEDPAAKLAKLKTLLDQGLITQQEFDAKKQEILAKL